jgi:N-acetylmuramoyl-L-alanine amidase
MKPDDSKELSGFFLFTMNIIQKKTSHFTKGRSGYKPIGIVVHIMAGTLKGTASWFANEVSGVSAHYGVGKAGEVYQWVEEKDTARHAGVVDKPTWSLLKRTRPGDKGVINPNLYTVGIEHEGHDGEPWTEAMYLASAELIAAIAKRWDIPIDANHIVPHHAIRVSKTCPGKGCDLTKLIEMAKSFSKKE